MVNQPHRWNIRFIRNFTIISGPISSIFDCLTFAMLSFVFGVAQSQDSNYHHALFRTGWFLESLLTELVVALIVRTCRPFFRSRPGRLLWVSTLSISLLTFAIPEVPARIAGFQR